MAVRHSELRGARDLMGGPMLGRVTLGAAYHALGRRSLVRGWAANPARPVAVERVAGLGRERLAAALAQIPALAPLEHPNLPGIVSGFARGGALHIALTPGAGLPLGLRPELLTQRGALDLGVQICNGLNFLRWRGLALPAVTPYTVFVTDAGRVKMTNIAALLGAATPRSHGVFGAVGDAERAAVWGVGATLHHALTGWRGDYRQGPPPALALRPDLTPACSAVLVRALAARPRDRFADSAALRYAILMV